MPGDGGARRDEAGTTCGRAPCSARGVQLPSRRRGDRSCWPVASRAACCRSMMGCRPGEHGLRCPELPFVGHPLPAGQGLVDWLGMLKAWSRTRWSSASRQRRPRAGPTASWGARVGSIGPARTPTSTRIIDSKPGVAEPGSAEATPSGCGAACGRWCCPRASRGRGPCFAASPAHEVAAVDMPMSTATEQARRQQTCRLRHIAIGPGQQGERRASDASANHCSQATSAAAVVPAHQLGDLLQRSACLLRDAHVEHR